MVEHVHIIIQMEYICLVEHVYIPKKISDVHLCFLIIHRGGRDVWHYWIGFLFFQYFVLFFKSRVVISIFDV